MQFRNEYWFLSNMSAYPVRINGITYHCSEAAFQSFKLADKAARQQFAGIDGYQAKALGKKVQLRPDWETIKDEVMLGVVRAKFHQHPELMKQLRTIEGEICEDNTWGDCYWGKCNGSGKNKLGEILMKIRSEANE